METRIEVSIPENVTADIKDNVISVTGEKGSLQRELWYPGIVITKTDSTIVVETEKKRRKQAAIVGTFASHIRNMIKGVSEGYTYKMKVVFSHFPIQLKVEEDHLSIGNFLGEKKPRVARIYPDVNVSVKGNEVIVSGINKEHVGQTAANIEQATRIKGFDPRVFQDGIYLVEKA
jgi:large subunit ribosomal protein L6